MAYPYYDELQRLVPTMNNGNFGLWYNKFIPLNNLDACKAGDQKGDDKNVVEYYRQRYANTFKDAIARLLDQKHFDQAQFCNCLSAKFNTLVFKTKLQAPLITGIGESHPHEVSMMFDHNMGIPYIPASGIKGIVRFAHTLGLYEAVTQDMIKQDKDGKEFFDDEADWTNIPSLFGTQKSRGKVIFLDAYPEKIPDLHVDIMNPHYAKYYSDDKSITPPADYLDPTPIKFLTVSKGTTFIFRALVDRECGHLLDSVKTALRQALTEEGVGAKTAVGYGVFETPEEEEAKSVHDLIKREEERREQETEQAIAAAEAERFDNLSEDERMIERIRTLQKDPNEISTLIAQCLAGGYERDVYEILKETLSNLDEWKPAGSKQRKQKMRERNAKIDAKITG